MRWTVELCPELQNLYFMITEDRLPFPLKPEAAEQLERERSKAAAKKSAGKQQPVQHMDESIAADLERASIDPEVCAWCVIFSSIF